jgi:hypothetical protein
VPSQSSDTREWRAQPPYRVGNALEEAVGFEMALSMDARCSRIMEKLLKACTDGDLVRYLEVGLCTLESS